MFVFMRLVVWANRMAVLELEMEMAVGKVGRVVKTWWLFGV